MKNKYKLLFIILIIIVASASVFYLNITGSLVAETEEEIPETIDKVLLSPQEIHVRPDNTTYIVETRYKVGENVLCYSDCQVYCNSQNLTIYKGYSRRFGECLCKCLPEEVSS